METIIGIDLGTTNSEVAVIRNGRAEVLVDETGEKMLPSVVGFDEQGTLLVGAAARNQWLLAPERTVRSVKRLMGSDERVRLGDQQYSPQEISAIILRTLKERAEKALGEPLKKAVITVPAFFNETQREATREAGEMAGLEVVRIINEPTAASLTYDPQPDRLERLLVYDLGGGTFDVSIVQVEQQVVEVLASHGDTHLGGDDFDQLLLDYVAQRFLDDHGVDLRTAPTSKSRLLQAVEEAKKALSAEPVAQLREEFIAEKKGTPLHLSMEIRREDYEAMVEPLLEKTLKCVDEALSDAQLTANQIDTVVLVGGASRTPIVQRLLSEQLGKPVHTEVDPDLCVAMGAAVQAGLIAGIDVGPVLVDITPHTLGISTLGTLHGFPSPHHFAPVIPRNTSLPARRSQIFYTCQDNQEAADISVYQGEDEDVRYNDQIGEFLLEDLSEAKAGNEILVRFELDLSGLLKVTAVERITGREKQLTFNNAVSRFRISSREAAQQRIDSAFAAGAVPPPKGEQLPVAADSAADEELPAPLRKAILHAEGLILKAEKAVDRAAAEDAAEIRRLIDRIRQAIAAHDAQAIEAAAAELEDLVFYLQDA